MKGPFCKRRDAEFGMRNKHNKEAKDRKHKIQDKIENFSKQRRFLYRDGNRFEITAQGLFYCPKAGGAKKHPCPDCYFCQWCSDSRCGLCRKIPGSCPTGKEASD